MYHMMCDWYRTFLETETLSLSSDVLTVYTDQVFHHSSELCVSGSASDDKLHVI